MIELIDSSCLYHWSNYATIVTRILARSVEDSRCLPRLARKKNASIDFVKMKGNIFIPKKSRFFLIESSASLLIKKANL